MNLNGLCHGLDDFNRNFPIEKVNIDRMQAAWAYKQRQQYYQQLTQPQTT